MKPNLGDVIADKYRIDRVLGEGGMSTVYAAVNAMTGKQVAIKWLQPELVGDEEQSQRLLREAQATSAIDHPNVVNVFDIGRHDGALFLVMELLHGEPLSELLMRGAQAPYEFVRMMMPVLRGVHAAHRVGVVHRDLKPDNIFFCRDTHGNPREPKVLDFGISKLANDRLEAGRELTREGTVFGTPQYMAPEQMRDARSADARSDVYALGVIFYRAFSNQYPYDADTLTALAIRIVEGNAPPLHELVPLLDRGLSDVVMHALSLDPSQRYASIAEFAQALEPYANGATFLPTERDSFPALRRDSTPLVFEHQPSSRRIAPPPPPPRTGSMRTRDNPASQQRDDSATRLINPADLLEDATALITEERAPLRRDSKLSIPPPPPPVPTLSRPSHSLELADDDDAYATHRLEKRSRGQSWGFGVALLGIGLLAPLGWQQWQKARGAVPTPAAGAQPTPAIKSESVYAAQAMRPASASEQTAAQRDEEPTAQRDESPMLVPEPAAVVTSEGAEPVAEAVPVVPAPSWKPAASAKAFAKRAGPKAVTPAPVVTSLANHAPTPSAEPEALPVQPAATMPTERNPYLRR